MRSLSRFCLLLLPLLLPLILWPVVLAEAQTSGGKKGVQITFLPPPLENASFSLGVYDVKSGKLVRRLQEGVSESAFTVGLNGLITKWDGKDDTGKPVPPGRYAARGYGVGPLKVEGVEFLGNDWIDEDESLRIKHIEAIALIPEDDGLGVIAKMADGGKMLLRIAGKDGVVLWKEQISLPAEKQPSAGREYQNYFQLRVDENRIIVVWSADRMEAYRLKDGSKDEQARPQEGQPNREDIGADRFLHDHLSVGKDGTWWFIYNDLDSRKDMLYQFSKDIDRVNLRAPDQWAKLASRGLSHKEDEPSFRTVSASTRTDRLYLLEEMPGWQRVRGLSWVESKEEDGKKISNWDTFFERNIRQSDPTHGLADPSAANTPPSPVKIDLVANPLSPGKAAPAELTASFDENGSYLVTTDGLRLRKISKQSNLRAVKLVKGNGVKSLTLFQNDGAAWEEFSIKGADEMMSFDAGEFVITADGEKPNETKPVEPPDL